MTNKEAIDNLKLLEQVSMSDELSKALQIAIRNLENAPKDAVSVVYGRWKEVRVNNCGVEKRSGRPWFRCSVCNRTVWSLREYSQMDDLLNYCPCCGAKMDGEKNGEG